ncbi:MAG TPA: hypothetical protein VGL94_18890, partial [Ktedonobacteraceae bacterium]
MAAKRQCRSPRKRKVTLFKRSQLVVTLRLYVHFLWIALQSMWSLARLDLLLWRRTPWAIASVLIPPLGMAIMLVVLSFTVTQ